MPKRRSELRLMCSDLVELVVHQAPADERAIAANLEDISPSGACVQIEEGVREGSQVEIIGSAFRLNGTVRYCRFTPSDMTLEFRSICLRLGRGKRSSRRTCSTFHR